MINVLYKMTAADAIQKKLLQRQHQRYSLLMPPLNVEIVEVRRLCLLTLLHLRYGLNNNLFCVKKMFLLRTTVFIIMRL
jgi:hypothetical protein